MTDSISLKPLIATMIASANTDSTKYAALNPDTNNKPLTQNGLAAYMDSLVKQKSGLDTLEARLNEIGQLFKTYAADNPLLDMSRLSNLTNYTSKLTNIINSGRISTAQDDLGSMFNDLSTDPLPDATEWLPAPADGSTRPPVLAGSSLTDYVKQLQSVSQLSDGVAGAGLTPAQLVPVRDGIQSYLLSANVACALVASQVQQKYGEMLGATGGANTALNSMLNKSQAQIDAFKASLDSE